MREIWLLVMLAVGIGFLLYIASLLPINDGIKKALNAVGLVIFLVYVMKWFIGFM